MRTPFATALAILAGLLGPVAIAAWDASRVLLDTDRWVETTAPVIEDGRARHALATMVVERTAARLECDGGLVGRVTSSGFGARARAGAVAELEQQLGGERARRMWRDANRGAHARFVAAARSDAIELDERLLDAAKLVELAATAIAVLDRADELLDGGGDDPADPCGGGSTFEVMDGDALRAAGLLARVLESASWLPTAIGAASVALLALALLVARRRLAALATFAVVGALLALGAVASQDQLESALVDGIASEPARDLAAIVLGRALEPPVDHLRTFALALALVAVLAAVLAIASRRRDRLTR